MGNQFIRFTPKNYYLEEQIDCLSDDAIDQNCPVDEEYKLPAKPGDIIKFIIPKTDVTYDGSLISDLKVALVRCGVNVSDDIGTIEEGDTQLFITATIPSSGIDDADCYQLVVYDSSLLPPVECGIFAGSSLQDTIDSGLVLSQLYNCTLNDFL